MSTTNKSCGDFAHPVHSEDKKKYVQDSVRRNASFVMSTKYRNKYTFLDTSMWFYRDDTQLNEKLYNSIEIVPFFRLQVGTNLITFFFKRTDRYDDMIRNFENRFYFAAKTCSRNRRNSFHISYPLLLL